MPEAMLSDRFTVMLGVSSVEGFREELVRFTACAQQSALQLFGAREALGSRARLSRRELEVLRRTMAGKTAWEVGVILGISEQTVVRHLGHAAQKLGCVNKVQAVAKALLMGLIA